MKGLFIHDHVFHEYEHKHYSPGGLPSVVWDRYLEHVNDLTVISRGKKATALPEGMILSNKQKVDFKLLYQVRGGVDYYRYKSEIKQRLEEEIQKADVIIIRLPSTIGSFAADICNKHSIDYITEVVGCAWDSNWNYGSLMIKVQAPYRYFKMKQLVAKSTASIYVTEFFLQSRYPNKGITSHASNVQIPEFDSDVLEKHLTFLKRQKAGLRFGIIGNLSIQYKGFDVAFKALSKLKKDGLKFVFYLVGGGDQTYIKQLIIAFDLTNEVEVVGRLESGSKVFEFLDSLDLYIHPSKQEGLPRAVIEAMSRACPVVASSVAGIPELLSQEFLHKPGDSEKLYTDLVRVLNKKDGLEAMAITNFNKSKDYVIDTLKTRRSEFFKQVITNINKS